MFKIIIIIIFFAVLKLKLFCMCNLELPGELNNFVRLTLETVLGRRIFDVHQEHKMGIVWDILPNDPVILEQDLTCTSKRFIWKDVS